MLNTQSSGSTRDNSRLFSPCRKRKENEKAHQANERSSCEFISFIYLKWHSHSNNLLSHRWYFVFNIFFLSIRCAKMFRFARDQVLPRVIIDCTSINYEIFSFFLFNLENVCSISYVDWHSIVCFILVKNFTCRSSDTDRSLRLRILRIFFFQSQCAAFHLIL